MSGNIGIGTGNVGIGTTTISEQVGTPEPMVSVLDVAPSSTGYWLLGVLFVGILLVLTRKHGSGCDHGCRGNHSHD